jgi:Raf kinase inhibitor-like YbhB/YbcL family protein
MESRVQGFGTRFYARLRKRGEPKVAFKLTVEGFLEGARIPKRFTCEGDDVSPALSWIGEPAETQSFAVLMDDPDAPGGSWNHWLLWDIPSDIHSLPECNEHSSLGITGTNDFRRRGYGGPCPPQGRGSHRYFFRLFAMAVPVLGLAQGAKRPAFQDGLRKHAIAETAYMGRYERM